VCYFETTNFVRSVLVQERGGTNSGKRSDAPQCLVAYILNSIAYIQSI